MQVVNAPIVRRSRPIVAAVTDKRELAVIAVATTRSRIPDGRGGTELAGEVYAFVGAVVCASVR